MILATFNGLWDIIRIPFGWLLAFLYDLTSNYGVALIIFAVALKLIMFPMTAKSKKSTMKMSRLTPKIQVLQKKYANDQQKLNEATQALYKEEGVSMGSGCLWSFLPILILFPLYSVVRQPILYILHETEQVAAQIMEAIKAAQPELIAANANFYEQMIVAPKLPALAEAIPALKEIAVANADTLAKGVDFSFLGINLGEVPTWRFWEAGWVWDWAHIGAFLLPVISSGSQVISMLINQRMNNSLITDEKGIQDKETAKNSQQNQQGKMMLWMMPLMSLWIGFTFPAALGLYWLVQGVVSTILDVILTQHYRKVYDAEDAARLEKAMEQEAIEAEKERLRAERRAANPDGITQNTSKKKLQQQQKAEQEAAKAAAKKEYDAKKGIHAEEAEDAPLSGVTERPFCKGRAYDPNRYQQKNTEE